MSEVLRFMGEHPVLTFLLIIVLASMVVRLVRGYSPYE